MALVIWIIIGGVIGLAYIPFVHGIDTHLAGRPWGFSLLYLFTFFLWPVLLVNLLARRVTHAPARR